jgi:nucleotide-binding universal stress UspA family protein
MYRRILVPLDGSSGSRHALDAALSLADRYGASLAFLHVVDQTSVLMDNAMGPAWADVLTHLEAQGQRLLQDAHAAATSRGIASETHLEGMTSGRVSDRICDRASALHCNLIVMGSHGRRGLERALLGSDAERVVRHSTLPVLVVRHGEGA